MPAQLFVGVDGGASKVIVRVEDEYGHLLGREQGGPATIRHSVIDAWHSIHAVLDRILQSLHLSLDDRQYHFHAGMGLAGCELQDARQAFLDQPCSFKTLVVTSDAHTACLGAHDGKEGAIIVIGTGVVGYQLEQEPLKGQCMRVTKTSGWGFPHDDQGGGAWMGLHAVMLTFQWLDKRAPASPLAKAVYAHFRENVDDLVTWANRANATAFAELAPIVIDCAKANDEAAISLLRQAASAIDAVGEALLVAQSTETRTAGLPCALTGGMAPFIEPYLGEKLHSRLVPCQSVPDKGAILLVRQALSARGIDE